MARPKRWATFSLDPLAILTDPDFLAMSHPAQRAHLLLVLNAWNQKDPGVIPGPSSRFAFMLELTPEAWAEIEPEVRSGAKVRLDGSWAYPAMEMAFTIQERTHFRLSAAGIKRASAMWGNKLDSPAIAGEAIAPASASASGNATEKEKKSFESKPAFRRESVADQSVVKHLPSRCPASCVCEVCFSKPRIR